MRSVFRLRQWAIIALWAGMTAAIGCDRSEPASPVAPVTPSATMAVEADDAAAAPVEPAHEARVRAMARDLNALAAEHLRDMKVGEEAILLVRGDARGGTIYGSGPYTQDSRLGRAAVHAGALEHDELGLLRVRMFKHDGEHTSVEQNGIRPNKWGKYYASYTVERVDPVSTGE